MIMDAYSEDGIIERKDSITSTSTAGSSSNEDTTSAAEPQPARRRVHYGILAALYLIVLVLAGVALGSFGASETNVHNFVNANYPPERRANNCILYASFLGYEINDVRQVAMFNPGPCGFVLWGQVSVFIVVLVWFVSSVGQLLFLKPDILSPCRFIDLLMSVVTAILTLVLSIVVHAGLDATCHAVNQGLAGCEDSRIVVEVGGDSLHFYHSVHVSRSSSWLLLLFFTILLIWYIILATSYCYKANQRRRQALEDLYDINKPI